MPACCAMRVQTSLGFYPCEQGTARDGRGRRPIEADAVIRGSRSAWRSFPAFRQMRNVTYSSAWVSDRTRHPPRAGSSETPLMLDRSVNLPACMPPGKSTLDLKRAKELLKLDDEEIAAPPPGSGDEGLFSRVYWRIAVCEGPPGMFKAVANTRRELGQTFQISSWRAITHEFPWLTGHWPAA